MNPEQLFPTFNIAGLRPRTPPYSFSARQKSRQKNAPQLLALRVPHTTQPFWGRAKTRWRSNSCPSFSQNVHFTPAASQEKIISNPPKPVTRQKRKRPGG